MHSHRKLGVWILGAHGSVASAVIIGKYLLKKNHISPIGLLTTIAPYCQLDFVEWENIEFGGIDINLTSKENRIQNLIQEGIIPMSALKDASSALAESDKNVVSISQEVNARDAYSKIRTEIQKFKHNTSIANLIVLDLSSTEPILNNEATIINVNSLSDFFQFTDSNPTEIPWNMLYALAAAEEGAGYINFTPNCGTDLRIFHEFMIAKKRPYAGKDGKTGETLIKSVLAPLFAERNLPVLTWQGYNMLGNSDGHSLSEPARKARKLESKKNSLARILPHVPNQHFGVEIDYIPSLGDWKTAWNFIHFQGFLGARMNMQLTWSGCDTALAAPLVLDLVRWVEYALCKSEYGHLNHLASYFKSPYCIDDYSFIAQIAMLKEYCNNKHI